MLKLNKRKIRWIVREIIKGNLSVYRIARIQRITPQHARRVYKKYNGVKNPVLLPCGCKPKRITDGERKIVIGSYKEMHMSAVRLEAILKTKGIFMPHNRIHRILKEEGLAKNEPNKQRQRKWVRYERRHSNSLWHADWFEHDSEQLILIEDDASRLLVGFGAFKHATVENSARILKEAIDRYGYPKQLLTDHGTQFVSLPKEGCQKPEPTAFQKLLEEYKIQHIKARVKHPQSNGKAERLVQTLKRHKTHFRTWEKTTEYYNFKRPHMSLDNDHLRTPYQAFIDKMR
jgi:putative transposase